MQQNLIMGIKFESERSFRSAQEPKDQDKPLGRDKWKALLNNHYDSIFKLTHGNHANL